MRDDEEQVEKRHLEKRRAGGEKDSWRQNMVMMIMMNI